MCSNLTQTQFPVKQESEWLYTLAEANADDNFENAYRACAKAYHHCQHQGAKVDWRILVDAFKDAFAVADSYFWPEPVSAETAVPDEDYFVWAAATHSGIPAF